MLHSSAGFSRSTSLGFPINLTWTALEKDTRRGMRQWGRLGFNYFVKITNEEISGLLQPVTASGKQERVRGLKVEIVVFLPNNRKQSNAICKRRLNGRK